MTPMLKLLSAVILLIAVTGCVSSEQRDAARQACEYFGGLGSVMFDMSFDVEATCNDGTQIKHMKLRRLQS